MNAKALHKIGYGLYVVTSKQGERFSGQIANTVFQVTAEPPRIAVSINRKNLTWQFIKESKVFIASVLCQETPLTFIGRFGLKSGRDTNKFEGVNYKIGQTGAPVVLDNAVAYFEARVTQEIDMGTHTIFIGELVDAEVISDDTCMTYDYYHQIKGGKTPQAAATYVAGGVEAKEEAKPGMAKYKCTICGYVYDPGKGDPDNGIKPGTAFESLPQGWVCPVCGADKSQFEKAG